MWKKSKQIFNEPAQLPTVIEIGSSYRIFYSYRLDGISHINYFDIDKDLNLTYKNLSPILGPGKRGCFDDKGVMPSCMVGPILYYTGWNTDKNQVPYGHAVGAAVWSESQNQFKRLSDGPILDRSFETPFLSNSPFICKIEKKWKMWFCNGIGWDENFPLYSIYSCKSNTNLFQEKNEFQHEIGDDDEACSRPCVYKNKIYFSKKKKTTSYEIYSWDGQREKKELAISNTGWDSEMACYPYVINNIMFYNGNKFGATGIGVAECIDN